MGQTQDLNPANVDPPADRNISIQQLIDFVKSDFADSELFTEEMPPVKKKPERRFSIAPEPEYSVAVDWPEPDYSKSQAFEQWMDDATEGRTWVDPYGNPIWGEDDPDLPELNQ